MPPTMKTKQDTHQSQLLRRFGATVLKEGYTCIPNLLLRYQAELYINPTQMNIINQIWMSWWEHYPFPAIKTVAARMRRSDRCIQVNLRKLENPHVDPETGRVLRPKLISIRARQDGHGGSLSNQYDFMPLLEALEKLAKARGGVNLDSPGGESTFTRGVNLDSPGGESTFTRGVNLDSPKKDEAKKTKRIRLNEKESLANTEVSQKTQRTRLTHQQTILYSFFDHLFQRIHTPEFKVARNAVNRAAIDELIEVNATPQDIELVFSAMLADKFWREHMSVKNVAQQYTPILTMAKLSMNGHPRDAPSTNGTSPMTPEQRLEYDLAQYNRNRAKQKKPLLTMDEFRQLLEQARKGQKTDGTP